METKTKTTMTKMTKNEEEQEQLGPPGTTMMERPATEECKTKPEGET
jgi:hypothetical protein